MAKTPAQPTKKHVSPYYIAGPIIMALTVLCAYLLYVVLTPETTPEKEKVSTDETSQENKKISQPSNTDRPTGNKANHRKSAADKATNLIEEARLIARRPNINELKLAVAKGELKDLPKSFTKQFRFADQLQADPELKSAAYLSILQLGEVLNNNVEENIKLKPIHAKAWEYVYLDPVAGHAFVPLSIFLGGDAAFSLEFVWVEGKWQFTPYSFIDAVSSAEIALQGSLQQKEQEENR